MAESDYIAHQLQGLFRKAAEIEDFIAEIRGIREGLQLALDTGTSHEGPITNDMRASLEYDLQNAENQEADHNRQRREVEREILQLERRLEQLRNSKKRDDW